jgi:hypothetical protein
LQFLCRRGAFTGDADIDIGHGRNSSGFGVVATG